MVLVAALTLLAALPASAEGQVEASDDDGRAWWNAWSVPSAQTRLTLGMWSLHPFEHDFPEFDAHWGVGIQYRGWFGFTFVNSYDQRTVAAGVERSWLRGDWGPLGAMLGFRLGLVYGYNERLIDLAGRTPVLPGGQLLSVVRLGPVSAEIAYVYRAISIMGGIHF